MTERVSVAIPVRNGGARLGEVLAAVRAQTVPCELVIADSASVDGSADLARSFDAEVFGVERFSHSGTRNELMSRTSGDVVAFLTQDALPASPGWLQALLDGFSSDDVALVYGPAQAGPGAPVAIARELSSWFPAATRVDRTRTPSGPGLETFFTSSNGAVRRSAWRSVPFPDVQYAEDQALASAMLRAGYAKVFEPGAAVIHWHDYGPLEQFRRAFDEWRALHDVHGWVQPLAPLTLQREVRDDIGAMDPVTAREVIRSLRHHTVRAVGGALGSRADRLPARVREWCSLEERA
ncbi:glycosyltransferase family 2 protein [Solirubrobacter soli]|uniref:glycosyltransferase family 2 protein n=1 Tax=Solirubrobacter soli TaxID=363832 RepID=UPI00069E6FE5|nr:glycosyltransferase family 2 protein [Solirubrobacter soli]